MSRMLSLRAANSLNAAEALWFTTDNRLAEGCISNVFVVKDSLIQTPPASTPVLPGIARKTVLKIASDCSMRTAEKDLHIDDLLDADEVFITNVIMQVIPVTTVEKQVIGSGKVGPITTELIKRFSDYVNEACGKTAG